MTSQSLIDQNQILIMCLQLLQILIHNIHLYTSIHKNTAKYQKDKRMLDIRQHKVKLKKTYEQILFLAVAFCDSYVFQGRRSVGQDVIVHCNKDGAILYEYLPDCLIDSFAMLSDRQILFLEPKKHKICCINLETQIITKFNHYFMSEESDRAVIDTFASTNLACVVQTGRYNDNRLFLTYYAFDQFRKQETFKLVPFFRFESVDDQWTHEMVVSKADTHSMYLWYWRRHDKFITLNYFDLKNLDLMQRPDRAYRKLIMTNSMGQLYNLPEIQCSIQNAWLLEEGKVLLQCQTDKIQKQAYSKQNIVINTFVLDLQKEHIRQTKFSFHPIYNDFLIDCYNLGQFSIFKTFFYYFNGSVQKTPYYFVQNSTQKILKTDNRSECTYKLKHLIPGYKFNTIYENQYENSKIEEFTIRQHFVVKMDMLYVSFLLHLNEDFDDDLLKDACELLDQRDM